MNNEYTRKEKPCFLSNGEFCDKEDKNCDRCIAEEEQYQYESVYIRNNKNTNKNHKTNKEQK